MSSFSSSTLRVWGTKLRSLSLFVQEAMSTTSHANGHVDPQRPHQEAIRRHSRLFGKSRVQASANPRRGTKVSSSRLSTNDSPLSQVERPHSNSDETTRTPHPTRRSKRKLLDRRTQDIPQMSHSAVRPSITVSVPMDARDISVVIPLSVPPILPIGSGLDPSVSVSLSAGASSSASSSLNSTSQSVSASSSSGSGSSQSSASSISSSSASISISSSSSSLSRSQSLTLSHSSSSTASYTRSTSQLWPASSSMSTSDRQCSGFHGPPPCPPVSATTSMPERASSITETPRNPISVDGFITVKPSVTKTHVLGGPSTTPKLGRPGKDASPFSRNTGAIIGVAFASVILLTLLSLFTFFVCKRYRRRILARSRLAVAPLFNRSNGGSPPRSSDDNSEQKLVDPTRPSGPHHRGSYSGSAFSFVLANAPMFDGEDSETDHLPQHRRAPSFPPPILSLNEKHPNVLFPSAGSSSNTVVPPLYNAKRESGPVSPLAPLSSRSTTRTLVTVNHTPPSSTSRSSFSSPLSMSTTSAVPSSAGPVTAEGMIRPSISLNGEPLSYHHLYPSAPWLNRMMTNHSAHSFLTLGPEPLTPGIDSDRRFPTDGLLHPSLLYAPGAYLNQAPSTPSLFDHIDYSRPISGFVRNGMVPQGSSTTIPTIRSNVSQDGHSNEIEGPRTSNLALAV